MRGNRAGLVATLCLSGLSFSTCNMSNELNVDALDVGRYSTNWTQMARTALKKAKDSQKPVSEFLGGTDALKNGLFPAFVPLLAGNCGEGDVQKIIDDLRSNEVAKGIRNNLVLQGDPGIDVDVRVQALAWRIALENCAGIPESWEKREVISIDLKLLAEDAATMKLSSASYIKVLRKNLDMFGSQAVFYLNDFTDLRSQRLHADDVLKLFLEYDANVIIEVSDESVADFSADSFNDKVFRVRVEPIDSEKLVPVVAAIAKIDATKTGVIIPAKTSEEIVRLSRAFLSSRGPLSQAMQTLKLVALDAQTAPGKTADDTMVINAVVDLNEKLKVFPELKAELIKRSDARTDALSDIDSNVKLISKYYVDATSRNLTADAVRKSLEPAYRNLEARINNLQDKLGEVEQKILADLLSKTNLLRQRIARMSGSLSGKIRALELSTAKQLLEQSAMIVAKFELMDRKTDSVKMELMSRIAQAQASITSFVEEKFEALSEKQEKMVVQLSSAQAALASAISNVDAKVDTAKNEMLQKLATAQAELAAQADALGVKISDSQAEMIAEMGKSQAALSGAIAGVNANVDATKVTLLQNIATVQAEIVAQGDRLGTRISDSQAEMIAQMGKSQASLSSAIAGVNTNLDATKVAMLQGLAKSQADLVAQGDRLGARISESQAQMMSAIGKAQNELASSIAGVDTKIDSAKTQTLKVIGDVQTEIVHQLGLLGTRIDQNHAAAILEAANVNQSLAMLTGQVTTLSKNQSDTFAQLLEIHKSLSTSIRELESTSNERAGVLEKLLGSVAALSDAVGKGQAGVIYTLTNLQGEMAQRFEALGKQMNANQMAVTAELSQNSRALTIISTQLETLSKNESETYTQLLESHKESTEKVLLALKEDGSQASEDLAKLLEKIRKVSVKTNILEKLLIDTDKAIIEAETGFQREARKTNCEENAVAAEVLGANQMIVQCGVSCFVVEHRFWKKADEIGDRKSQKKQTSFEIDLTVKNYPQMHTVRCEILKN